MSTIDIIDEYIVIMVEFCIKCSVSGSFWVFEVTNSSHLMLIMLNTGLEIIL